MITILIGDNNPMAATLEFPELRKLPNQFSVEVAKHMLSTSDPVIRTCSESVINIVGTMIDQKLLKHDECFVHLDDDIFPFDEEGVLTKSHGGEWWPFGILSCFGDELDMYLGEVSHTSIHDTKS